jgi:uncharacterized phage protein gp47/JayE
MIYGTKDKAQIVNSILDSLQQNAGIAAVQPGSVARAFAEAMGSEIADLYSSLSFTLRQGGLATASGRNLDLIGDLYNVRRKDISDNAAAERQSYNIEFYIQAPYSVDIVIPKGTIVYTNVDNFTTKQYKFKLNGTVVIGASTTRAYGLVIPDFTDNTYTAPVGSLTRHNFISPPGVVLYCNNPKEVYAIINSESDDNYRSRIIAALKTRTAGTVEAVRFAALSIKGVRDVRLRESSYGLGSCDVIVIPESTAEIKTMPETVYDTIIGVKPVGVRFNIRVAEKISINLTATVTLSSSATQSMTTAITNQASLFVRRYLNSGTVGSIVSVSEIERQIKLSSDYIKFVTINSFNADGKDIPLKDFRPYSDKMYTVAGSISINSDIMGINNY